MARIFRIALDDGRAECDVLYVRGAQAAWRITRDLAQEVRAAQGLPQGGDTFEAWRALERQGTLGIGAYTLSLQAR